MTGAAMDAWSVDAFPIFAATVALIYAALVIFRRLGRRAAGIPGAA